MKNLLLLFVLISIMSCDDGDIIITSFEFDDATLQLCEGAKENEFVFFKINTANNEAISYNFIDATYAEQSETTSPIVLNLNDVNNPNTLIYRQFNTSISASYYCNNVPNSTIQITEELVSQDGVATITNTIVKEDDNDGVDSILESDNGIDPLGDPDRDGVPNYLDDDMNDAGIGDESNNIEEGFDTDTDLIADFKDQDDDNDNILTSAELPNGDPNDDSFLDTDDDDIPNYRDADDDGDGILTINEDIDQNGNPRDDDTDNDGIPNYLDTDDDGDGIPTSEDTDNPTQNLLPVLNNSVSTTFRTTVNITNLEFTTETEEFSESTFSFGFRELTIPIDNN